MTLAHQDNRYRPSYTARCLAAVEDAPDSLLVFTDYDEETAGGERGHTLNLVIERMLSRPYLVVSRSNGVSGPAGRCSRSAARFRARP